MVCIVFIGHDSKRKKEIDRRDYRNEKMGLMNLVNHLFIKIYRILEKKFPIICSMGTMVSFYEKSLELFHHTGEWLSKQKFSFYCIDDINYPTEDTIKDLHDFLVIKYSKDKDKIHGGILFEGNLSFEGVKSYHKKLPDPTEDLILRGAHIFNKFLEEGHPFVDGNKRTGWATLWIFLKANDILFSLPTFYSNKKQVSLVERWADGNIESDNINEIVEWIKQYVKK